MVGLSGRAIRSEHAAPPALSCPALQLTLLSGEVQLRGSGGPEADAANDDAPRPDADVGADGSKSGPAVPAVLDDRLSLRDRMKAERDGGLFVARACGAASGKAAWGPGLATYCMFHVSLHLMQLRTCFAG